MPPLWARWLLTILGFAALAVAIVIAIHAVNDSGASPSERSAALEADRESQIVIAEDQAPHASPLLRSGAPTQVALQRAIGTDMKAGFGTERSQAPCKACAAPRQVHLTQSVKRFTVRLAPRPSHTHSWVSSTNTQVSSPGARSTRRP